MSARKHLYLAILGSCATADAFRTVGWPTFVDPGLRVHDYVGRTHFRSMETGALEEGEFEPTADVVPEVVHGWSYRMAAGEVSKTHGHRLLRGAKTSDALIFDAVSSYLFRDLELSRGRTLLESWELEKFFRVRADSIGEHLWESTYELHRDAAIAFLSRLRAVRPSIKLALHVAPICLNDGVRFKTEPHNHHADFYARWNERYARDLERAIPGLATLQAPRESWSADPEHPYGRFPFHYRLEYYVALRKLAKRWLELPDDDVQVVRRDTP